MQAVHIYSFVILGSQSKTSHYIAMFINGLGENQVVPSASIVTITRMNASLRDLIMSLYDLSPLEFDLLFALIARKKAVALDDLSKEVDRDKTTVFRCLQKLVNLRICEKETKTLKEGGWYHVYAAIDVSAFKLETEKRVKEIKESFDGLLSKFETDLDDTLSPVYH
jgi:predicted transcriptional regulator